MDKIKGIYDNFYKIYVNNNFKRGMVEKNRKKYLFRYY